MAIQLKTDEMLEILMEKFPNSYEAYKEQIERVASLMATEIANLFECECGDATFEGLGFAGTCAPFYAKHDGQECPQEFAEYDDLEGWEVRS